MKITELDQAYEILQLLCPEHDCSDDSIAEDLTFREHQLVKEARQLIQQAVRKIPQPPTSISDRC